MNMDRKKCVLIVVLLSVLLLTGVEGCTRSKSGVIPTSTPVAAAMRPTNTPLPGGATVVAIATPTPTPTMVPGIPTLTPTPIGVATATPTEAVTPGLTPTPVSTPAPRAGFPYTVQWGDTLYSIAARFGTTVEALVQLNNLSDPHRLQVGQRLIIPGTPSEPAREHIVQPGENLFRIALRYGTTVEAIAAANRIVNPSFIRVGQRLVIPAVGEAPAGCTKVHVVQPGENLYRIALRYGTTAWDIAVANHLPNMNLIYAGQRLCIP